MQSCPVYGKIRFEAAIKEEKGLFILLIFIAIIMGGRQSYEEFKEPLPESITTKNSRVVLRYMEDILHKYSQVTSLGVAAALAAGGNERVCVEMHPNDYDEFVSAMKGQGYKIHKEWINNMVMPTAMFVKAAA